jgi:hypothetical protein
VPGNRNDCAGDAHEYSRTGHRVYKNFDPRARIIREMCHKVLASLGRTDNPLFELALRLEEIALKGEYFIERKLYPNVDFCSRIIYSAIGSIPAPPGAIMSRPVNGREPRHG